MKNNIYIIFALTILSVFNAGKLKAFMFWNQASSFSGSAMSYIAAQHSASLDITGSFTIEAWVHPFNSTSPAFQIIAEKRAGTLSNGYTLYLNNGRVSIRTNSSTRLVGKTVLPNNSWTHISGTYNSVNGLFMIYINGITDTSAIVINALPSTNTDSLRIGKGNINSPFQGFLDELRIWEKTLSGAEINRYRRTSLGTSTGRYDSLSLSYTFQDDESSGVDFSLNDWSGNGNTGRNNGVAAVDLSSRPLTTISLNECIELDGINDMLAGADNPDVSPVSAVTLEAWINPGEEVGNRIILQKGSMGTGINYGLGLNGGVLYAYINNNFSFTSNISIIKNKWTHVAFSYNGISGEYSFYKNGRESNRDTLPLGMITNGSDLLFIGGNSTSSNNFSGFIDEIRISNYVKPRSIINRYLYQSIDQANEPNSGMVNVVYNFDGYAYDNADSGPLLSFFYDASFSHSSALDNQPVSPINRADEQNFQDGFLLKSSETRIPFSGITGIVSDSIEICFDTLISDLNVFLALNHTAEEELNVYLQGPDGQTVNIFANNVLTLNSDNIITIFDDQADSSINSSVKFVSFSPVIKPKNPLSTVFSGTRSSGKWKLIINDQTGLGTGRLYSWGIQINNSITRISSLCLRVFMQGFYRPEDSCIVDTIKVHLNESTSPYLEVGVKGETPDNNYIAYYNFPPATFGTGYYLQVEHRNSIETWSANPIVFDLLSGSFLYDFTVSADSAYGSNQLQVDDIPLRFAMFGGDVNQDDNIDATDLSAIDNDAFSFTVGYVDTDLTGDDIVDASDYSIADNNSSAFITVIRP